MPVQGVNTLLAQLQARIDRYKAVTVKVEYSAPYAASVHENLMVVHKPPTQAKFLEQPLRTEGPAMVKALDDTLAKGGSLEDGLLAAGQVLLDASQQLVPVDTGRLKASGSVKVV